MCFFCLGLAACFVWLGVVVLCCFVWLLCLASPFTCNEKHSLHGQFRVYFYLQCRVGQIPYTTYATTVASQAEPKPAARSQTNNNKHTAAHVKHKHNHKPKHAITNTTTKAHLQHTTTTHNHKHKKLGDRSKKYFHVVQAGLLARQRHNLHWHGESKKELRPAKAHLKAAKRKKGNLL